MHDRRRRPPCAPPSRPAPNDSSSEPDRVAAHPLDLRSTRARRRDVRRSARVARRRRCARPGSRPSRCGRPRALPAVFAEWPSDDAGRADRRSSTATTTCSRSTPLELWEHPPFEPTVDGDRLLRARRRRRQGPGPLPHPRRPGAPRRDRPDAARPSTSSCSSRARRSPARRTSRALLERAGATGSPATSSWSPTPACGPRDTPTVCTGMRGLTDGQIDLHGPDRRHPLRLVRRRGAATR